MRQQKSVSAKVSCQCSATALSWLPAGGCVQSSVALAQGGCVPVERAVARAILKAFAVRMLEQDLMQYGRLGDWTDRVSCAVSIASAIYKPASQCALGSVRDHPSITPKSCSACHSANIKV